jgi:hypothetical protein
MRNASSPSLALEGSLRIARSQGLTAFVLHPQAPQGALEATEAPRDNGSVQTPAPLKFQGLEADAWLKLFLNLSSLRRAQHETCDNKKPL